MDAKIHSTPIYSFAVSLLTGSLLALPPKYVTYPILFLTDSTVSVVLSLSGSPRIPTPSFPSSELACTGYQWMFLIKTEWISSINTVLFPWTSSTSYRTKGSSQKARKVKALVHEFSSFRTKVRGFWELGICCVEKKISHLSSGYTFFKHSHSS